MKHFPARLGGKASGYNVGAVIHALPPLKPMGGLYYNGGSSQAAICGKRAKETSVGWEVYTDLETPVTCKRCLERIARRGQS